VWINFDDLVLARHILFIFVAIGASLVGNMARDRSVTENLELENKEYIEAAYACGVSTPKIHFASQCAKCIGLWCLTPRCLYKT